MRIWMGRDDLMDTVGGGGVGMTQGVIIEEGAGGIVPADVVRRIDWRGPLAYEVGAGGKVGIGKVFAVDGDAASVGLAGAEGPSVLGEVLAVEILFFDGDGVVVGLRRVSVGRVDDKLFDGG